MKTHKMTGKNPVEKKHHCDRRLFLVRGLTYLSGVLLGLNFFSDAAAGERRIFPIPQTHEQEPSLFAPSPKIAFIIDDIGCSISRARAFLALKMPMTFSVLPQ